MIDVWGSVCYFGMMCFFEGVLVGFLIFVWGIFIWLLCVCFWLFNVVGVGLGIRIGILDGLLELVFLWGRVVFLVVGVFFSFGLFVDIRLDFLICLLFLLLWLLLLLLKLREMKLVVLLGSDVLVFLVWIWVLWISCIMFFFFWLEVFGGKVV